MFSFILPFLKASPAKRNQLKISVCPNNKNKKIKILFIGEAVTTAHVSRPLVLAQNLNPNQYEVIFACDPRAHWMFKNSSIKPLSINSIPSKKFLKNLSKGAPVYDTQTLRNYVQEDLQIIKEIQPDLIVGDFRLSLSVSARLSNIFYMNITNTYWSPYARIDYPLPDIPLKKYFGKTLGQKIFDIVRPLAFVYHSFPLNRVRKEYGLASLGTDVRKIYTDADITLYADIPSFATTPGLPSNHRYLGPVCWSPDVALPEWWNEIPKNKPLIYFTLGSSGDIRILGKVLDAIAGLPVTAILATANRDSPVNVSKNTFKANYLPGKEAAARADLVICNGGSPATHQALSVGTPVLGLPSNLDQCLNMLGVEKSGAGISLPSTECTKKSLQKYIMQMISQANFKTAADKVKKEFSLTNALVNFRQIVAETVRDLGPGISIPVSTETGCRLTEATNLR